jgi:hypothetical protein
MRKIVTLALLILTATVGTAAADRYRGDHRGRDRGHVVRDHRDHRDYRRDSRPTYRRDYRSHRHFDYRYSDRRPVRYNNGYYTFNGGYRVAYRRPVITTRYYNYRVRPVAFVENYDPVPGYIWVNGSWSWNGYEWVWISGHYEVDANYVYSY